MNTVKRIMTEPSGVLRLILKRSQSIAQINKFFQASLESPLAQHCYVANLRDKTLIIHTDSSVWNTQLRFETPKILRSLQNNPALPIIESLRIKVQAQNLCS